MAFDTRIINRLIAEYYEVRETDLATIQARLKVEEQLSNLVLGYTVEIDGKQVRGIQNDDIQYPEEGTEAYNIYEYFMIKEQVGGGMRVLPFYRLLTHLTVPALRTLFAFRAIWDVMDEDDETIKDAEECYLKQNSYLQEMMAGNLKDLRDIAFKAEQDRVALEALNIGDFRDMAIKEAPAAMHSLDVFRDKVIKEAEAAIQSSEEKDDASDAKSDAEDADLHTEENAGEGDEGDAYDADAEGVEEQGTDEQRGDATAEEEETIDQAIERVGKERITFLQEKMQSLLRNYSDEKLSGDQEKHNRSYVVDRLSKLICGEKRVEVFEQQVTGIQEEDIVGIRNYFFGKLESGVYRLNWMLHRLSVAAVTRLIEFEVAWSNANRDGDVDSEDATRYDCLELVQNPDLLAHLKCSMASDTVKNKKVAEFRQGVVNKAKADIEKRKTGAEAAEEKGEEVGETADAEPREHDGSEDERGAEDEPQGDDSGDDVHPKKRKGIPVEIAGAAEERPHRSHGKGFGSTLVNHFSTHYRKWLFGLGCLVTLFLLAMVFPPIGLAPLVWAAMPTGMAAFCSSVAAWVMASAGHMLAGVVSCIAVGVAFVYPERILGLLAFVGGMAIQLLSIIAAPMAMVAEWSWRKMGELLDKVLNSESKEIPLRPIGKSGEKEEEAQDKDEETAAAQDDEDQQAEAAQESRSAWRRVGCSVGVVLLGILFIVAAPFELLVLAMAAADKWLSTAYVHKTFAMNLYKGISRFLSAEKKLPDASEEDDFSKAPQQKFPAPSHSLAEEWDEPKLNALEKSRDFARKTFENTYCHPFRKNRWREEGRSYFGKAPQESEAGGYKVVSAGPK